MRSKLKKCKVKITYFGKRWQFQGCHLFLFFKHQIKKPTKKRKHKKDSSASSRKDNESKAFFKNL
jgi:hypothetical protein